MTTQQTILELHDVAIAFGGIQALNGISLRLRLALERVYEQFPLLAGRRKFKAGDLSGGRQKILEVARGLMGEPQLLIVDEPSAGSAPWSGRWWVPLCSSFCKNTYGRSVRKHTCCYVPSW